MPNVSDIDSEDCEYDLPMDTLTLVQGEGWCPKTPLFLIHAVSGLSLPYFTLGALSQTGLFDDCDRRVYGISSPLYANSKYRLPSSMEKLAREYIDIIRQNIQPEGPYLLGGWSMGGMIAMQMAVILESMGEKVLHVIMIDSANPELAPPFRSPVEHDEMTTHMHSAMVQRFVMLGDTGSGNSSDSEDDYPDELGALLGRVRQHIHNGLHIIAHVRPGYFLKGRCNTHVTLMKCSLRATPSSGNETRLSVRTAFEDKYMGWDAGAFDLFDVVPITAEHDSCFDSKQSMEVTQILRRILSRID